MSSKPLRIQDENILPLEIGYLPQFAVKKSEEELNETPQRKIKAIQELRSLLQKNPKTSGIDFHDDLLVAYLRRNKYRMKDAQRQIQNLIHLQETENYVFKGVPEECLDLPSSKYMVLLPKRCQDGCALILLQWGKWDSVELPYERFRQVLVTLICQALRDQMTQINGFKVIHDWKGVSLKVTRYLTLHNLLQFYNTTANCFPARWKEIHIINQSSIFKIAWHLIKPFLTDKIRSRVYFHKTEELFDYFPRCILPIEYGGDVREIDTENWTRRANKEQQRFTLQGQPNYY